MLISHNYKFIFIHVPKTAGTSITEALYPYVTKEWSTIERRKKREEEGFSPHLEASSEKLKKYDKYFKFGFCRHPVDRFFSLYNFIKNTKDHFRYERVKDLTFIEFLEIEDKRKPIPKQADLLKGVDYIGRYETIYQSFKEICTIIGIEALIDKHEKRTIYNRFPTKKEIDYIWVNYPKEFEQFGYNKYEYK